MLYSHKNKMAITAKLMHKSSSLFRAPASIIHFESILQRSCRCLTTQNNFCFSAATPRLGRKTFFDGLGPFQVGTRTARKQLVFAEPRRFLSERNSPDKQTDFDDIKLLLKHKLEADKVEETDITKNLELLDILYEHRLQHVNATLFTQEADKMKPSDVYTLASNIFSLQDKVGQEAAILSGPLFKHAAIAGDSNAKYSYAQLLRTGQAGLDSDPKEAANILSELAKEGHPYSQYALAGMYYSGIGVTQNFETAYTLYQIAAENGVWQGFNMIGKMYLEGQSVDADFKKAFEYFKKGADNGDVNAYMSMAHCYTHEKGVEKDDKEAFRYHKMAADRGYAPAIFNLGAHHFSGRGVDLDMNKAAEHFRIAADKGFDYAQVNLGNMYYHGLGVEKDWKLARDWYKKAAPSNHNARLLLEELEEEIKKKGMSCDEE